MVSKAFGLDEMLETAKLQQVTMQDATDQRIAVIQSQADEMKAKATDVAVESLLRIAKREFTADSLFDDGVLKTYLPYLKDLETIPLVVKAHVARVILNELGKIVPRRDVAFSSWNEGQQPVLTFLSESSLLAAVGFLEKYAALGVVGSRETICFLSVGSEATALWNGNKLMLPSHTKFNAAMHKRGSDFDAVKRGGLSSWMGISLADGLAWMVSPPRLREVRQ